MLSQQAQYAKNLINQSCFDIICFSMDNSNITIAKTSFSMFNLGSEIHDDFSKIAIFLRF